MVVGSSVIGAADVVIRCKAGKASPVFLSIMILVLVMIIPLVFILVIVV